MSKIIYLSQMKLSNKLKRDWFLDDFIKNGLDIEFWDVSEIINHNESPNISIDNVKVKEFADIEILEEALKQKHLISACFIIIIPRYYETIKVYRLLARYNIFTIFFLWGESPNIVRQGNIFMKLIKYLSLHKNILTSFTRLVKRIITKIYIKFELIKKYDICFFAGDVCRNYNNGKIMHPINLCDYEQSLVNEDIPIIANDYAVFLDINLPYHMDVDIDGYKRINVKKYYSELNKFFDRFEKEYKMKVVIAGHPTSDYNQEVFNNREVIKLQTANLIKYSKHVLLHYSTAISYAIIYYKPMTFFVSSGMNKYYDYKMTKLLSSYLARPFIDLEKKQSLLINFPINKDLYDKYKYNYIVSSETESKKSFPIILENIKNNFSHFEL